VDSLGPVLAVAGVVVLFVAIFGFSGPVELIGAVIGGMLLSAGMSRIRGGR
jgi:hypothetical protein